MEEAQVIQNVQNNVLNGTYGVKMRVFVVSKEWKTFGIVVDENGTNMNYAACTKCGHVVTYPRPHNDFHNHVCKWPHPPICAGDPNKVHSDVTVSGVSVCVCVCVEK